MIILINEPFCDCVLDQNQLVVEGHRFADGTFTNDSVFLDLLNRNKYVEFSVNSTAKRERQNK